MIEVEAWFHRNMIPTASALFLSSLLQSEVWRGHTMLLTTENFDVAYKSLFHPLILCLLKWCMQRRKPYKTVELERCALSFLTELYCCSLYLLHMPFTAFTTVHFSLPESFTSGLLSAKSYQENRSRPQGVEKKNLRPPYQIARENISFKRSSPGGFIASCRQHST